MKKIIVNDDDEKNTPQQNEFIFFPQQQEETIVCDVCGHVNKKNVAICEMCSNYLFEENL